MKDKIDLSIFSSGKKNIKNTTASHIVIGTSVTHHYEHIKHGKGIRNGIYIKKYESENQENNPIVFFHGGPGIVNQEQFSTMTNYFTHRGHPVYIPEIEGSAMYCNKDITLPQGFEHEGIFEGLKLFDLYELGGNSGINEFAKNYVDDVKDVIIEVAKLHPKQKINIIAHSLGGHQVLRSLQYLPELNDKIESICVIAGTSNMGVNRFWASYQQSVCTGYNLFNNSLAEDSKRFLKSEANTNQAGPEITDKSNPTFDQEMNQEISVIYGDLSKYPPILIAHAIDDPNVFFQSSVLLYNKIKENGGIVSSLFWETGGHQFIKDEGNQTIRSMTLKKIDEFFKHHAIDSINDFSQLKYVDVVNEHQLFLKNPTQYLKDGIQDTSQVDSEPENELSFSLQ